MVQRLYQLFCQHCNFKKLTDGSDLANYTEVRSCQSCAGGRQFKCAKCGYLMKVSRASTNTMTDEMKALEKLRDQVKDDKERQKEELKRVSKERRLEDEQNDPSVL